MKNVGYYNGELGPLEEMKVPMLDRAVYFGDGVYDATTFRNGHIFGKEDHLDRFYNSCALIGIRFPLTREELTRELLRVVEANECDHGMLYWQASRGTAFRDHAYAEDMRPNLMIFTTPYDLWPMDRTMDLISVEDTRFLHCNIKTLNLLPSVMAYQQAVNAGCHEAVFHRGGRVTECAHSNVLMLKNGVLCTPPRDNLILPGITLKHLLGFAEQLGIPVSEAPFTLDELRTADEVIVSNSGALCARAVTLDGKPVGGKDPERLRALREAYSARYLAETGN
ncbi:MAG: D-amino acid aminotransferase [Clostridia bacterium]|nr:D-amino acid aminotransferase [Clostridia bacterium]